jgi:tetratricopeptide (TPR) repeat protein/energy-coupling factor transporter ATP-binding protein EcfA2
MTDEPSLHPFPGLRPFEADEEHLFFGREGQSAEILRRLRQHRFLAVVGTSGSGKSSLIRAGLLPHLYGGFLADGGSHWRVAIFRPGGDPIKHLATALNDPTVLGSPARSADEAAQDAVLLEVSLRRSGLGLIDAVQLARLPEHEQVVIVVDQFEELFRFADAADRPGGGEDAAAFVKLLLEASEQRDLPIYVVLTMRSDYIGDCARYSGLPEAVTNALYLIPRMTRDQRRAAIVEPVRVGGGTIAPRLVIRLLNDVGDDPDQLPILQHALLRTWDYERDHDGSQRAIDVDDYLAIGGMADALSKHADEAYDGLPDDRSRAIAKRIFQALSEKGPDNREARRPTTIGKLALVVDAPVEDIIRVVEDFRTPGRSFLTPTHGRPLNAETVIDISHESLIRGWRRMRQWAEEEAESARHYRRLADTAGLHAQGMAGLLRDPDLEHMLAWRDRERPTSDWGLRYHPGFAQAIGFLEQSRSAREAEHRQRIAARRRVQLAASAASAVITVVAVVALWKWHAADVASSQRQAAVALTIETVDALLRDFTQDPRMSGIPPEMKTEIDDRVIRSMSDVIRADPTAQAYVLRGLAYSQKGDLDRAMTECEQAVKLDPQYAPGYALCGIVFYTRKDHDGAIADFDQAIRIDPKYARAYANRAQTYEAKKDYDRAIADCDQAIALDPKYVNAYYVRGNVYEDKGDHVHAIADYDQAIVLAPNYALAYFARANIYYNLKDYDHAITDHSQAVALNPKYADAYNNRGQVYYAKQDYDRAIADYSEAIRIDPKDAVAYNNRGLAYHSQQDNDRAIADYNVAISINPNYAVAYDNRGDAYHGKKDNDRAIADYSKAIRIDPEYADAFNDRGNAYKDEGALDRAIADYDQAIALNPKNAIFYRNRGLTYGEKRDFHRAITDYDHAIALDLNYTFAYFNRGKAYLDMGDLDHAFADYAQAISLDPQNAYQYYSTLIDIAGRIIARDPQNADAYFRRGLVYSSEGSIEDAIADFERAITLNPKYVDAYFNRGNAYLSKVDLRHAFTDYVQALALDPQNANKYYSALIDVAGRIIARDPQNADAYFRRGLFNRLNGQLDAAIADYDQAIAINPKFAAAYYDRGNAYQTKHEYDRAIADYDQAIALDPQNASFYYFRGVAHLRKGLTDDAIADFDKLLALNPNDSDAYRQRGNAYEDKGDHARAIADYSQAIALDPTDSTAYNGRCWVEVIVGRDLEQALADCNESLRLRPNDPYTLDSRGFAYYKLGRMDEAIADFDAALNIDPKLPSSLYGRGLLKLKHNDATGGEADIASAKAIKPDIAQQMADGGIK